MVVAQLADRSPPTPEIRGSNRQTFIEHLFIVNCVEKTKIKKERGQEWPIFQQLSTDKHSSR